LSMRARPGEGGIRSRKIAILASEGTNARTVDQLASALIAEGAVVRVVAPHVGLAQAEAGEVLDADASFENTPSALFDAAVIADGDAAVNAMCGNGLALEFVREQFRHCKALM